MGRLTGTEAIHLHIVTYLFLDTLRGMVATIPLTHLLDLGEPGPAATNPSYDLNCYTKSRN